MTLKKDIFRYAPVWVLYSIAMLLALMEINYYTNYDEFAYYAMGELVHAFGIVNICYAGVSAVMLFGDLYNTKMCYSLHAMPYRRESWLLTHILSGLLFSLVPNAVFSLLLMYNLQKYWIMGLAWLLAVTLQYLFFFGLATVSAMLTGHRFAMLLVYAGFNFVAMLIYATVETLYLPMLTGVVANLTGFTRFSPTVHLFNFDFFEFSYKSIVDYDAYSNTRRFYVYEGLGDGWGYMTILAAVGLAAMGISLWLYRKRHLESAGDFVAFPKLKVASSAIITLCVALCMAWFGDMTTGGYVLWMAVGLVVGHFGGLMLLERRLKVFRKKTFGGLALIVAVMLLSLLAVSLDWLGIEYWTPRTEQVASVTVSNGRISYGSYSYYEPDIYYGSNFSTTLEDPADIENIIRAHEDILDRLDEYKDEVHRVTFVYKLKSGRTVTRSYTAPASGENYEIIRKYLYTSDSVLGFKDPAEAAKQVNYMYSSMGEVPAVLHEKLLSALQADAAKGYVMTSGSSGYYVEYSLEGTDGYAYYRHLAITAQAEQTIALLKSTEMLMGYADWDTFLDQTEELYIEFPTTIEYDLTAEQRQALLTAIRSDVEAGTLVPDQYDGNATMINYTVRYGNQGEYLYRYFYVTDKAQNTTAWLEAYIASTPWADKV